MRRIMLGGAVTALAAAIMPASGYAQSAAQAKVSGCRGLAEKDAAGHAGITPSERKVSLTYALTTRSAADDAIKDQVRLATHRVEVCYLEARVLVCPADGDDRWLIYDASVKPDGLDGVPIQDFDANDDYNVAYVTLPIDFRLFGEMRAAVSERAAPHEGNGDCHVIGRHGARHGGGSVERDDDVGVQTGA